MWHEYKRLLLASLTGCFCCNRCFGFSISRETDQKKEKKSTVRVSNRCHDKTNSHPSWLAKQKVSLICFSFNKSRLQRKSEFFSYVISGEQSANRPKNYRMMLFMSKQVNLPKVRVGLHIFRTSFFDLFLLICTSFVVRTRGIVCVVNLLFRLANYKDPCKRCILAQKLARSCNLKWKSAKKTIYLFAQRSSIVAQFRYKVNFFLTWHVICFLLDINECLNSSCGDNADCLDLPGGFKCLCKDDFTGKNCNQSKFEKLNHLSCSWIMLGKGNENYVLKNNCIIAELKMDSAQSSSNKCKNYLLKIYS